MREDCRYTLLVARRDLFFPHISIVLSAVLGRITCSSHWKKETLIVVIVCGRNICRRRLTQLTDLEILHVIVLSLSVTKRIVGTCYSFSLHCWHSHFESTHSWSRNKKAKRSKVAKVSTTLHSLLFAALPSTTKQFLEGSCFALQTRPIENGSEKKEGRSNEIKAISLLYSLWQLQIVQRALGLPGHALVISC